MRRRWLWRGAALAGLLLLLGGAGVYLKLYSVDLSDLRVEISGEIEAAIGRKVKISGPVTLGVSVVPYLSIHGLSVANEPWGKARKLLTVKKMNVRLKLYSLLRGAIEISAFEADGVALHLEVDGGERANWNLTTAEDSGSAVIASMKFSNIEIDYRDLRQAQTRYKTRLDEIKLEIENNKATFAVSGKLGEEAIEASGRVAPFYRTDDVTPRQFDFDAEVFGVSLRAGGTAMFPLHDLTTNVNFHIQAENGLKRGLPFFDLDLPEFGAFEAKGNMVGGNDVVKFLNLFIRAGGNDFDGVIFAHTDAQPLRFTAKLHSALLDISPAVDTNEKIDPAPRKRLFSAMPIGVRMPVSFNAGFRYTADVLRTGSADLTKLVVTADLDSGALHASRLDFDFSDGRISSVIKFAPRGDDVALSAKIFADSLDVTQLSEFIDLETFLSGKFTMLFEGESKGATPAALAAGLLGRSYLQISQGNIVRKFSSMISGDVIDIFRNVAALAAGGKDEPVACALAAFDIKQGRAEAKSILLLTQQAVVTGKGSIELGPETWRLSLKPRPRDVTLVNLATDIRVRGTLLEPQIEVNKSAVAKKVGVAALGFSLGPLGAAIGPLASAIRSSRQGSEREQCGAAEQAALTGLGGWPALRQLIAPSPK